MISFEINIVNNRNQQGRAEYINMYPPSNWRSSFVPLCKVSELDGSAPTSLFPWWNYQISSFFEDWMSWIGEYIITCFVYANHEVLWVLRRTVCVYNDWRLDNHSGCYLQSLVRSLDRGKNNNRNHKQSFKVILNMWNKRHSSVQLIKSLGYLFLRKWSPTRLLPKICFWL